MNTPVKDYVPFGDEWKAYVKRMPKDEIIRLFADSCSFKDDRIESLESQVKELREALNTVVLWASIKGDSATYKTSPEQIEEFKQLLNKQP